MKKDIATALLFVNLTISGILSAQSPELLKEINPAADSGSLPLFNAVLPNDQVLFTASEGEPTQSDVYTTDGTPAGTLKLIESTVDETESYFPFNLGIIGQNAIYTISGANGLELWATDGTAQGTVRLIETNIPVPQNGEEGENSPESKAILPSDEFQFIPIYTQVSAENPFRLEAYLFTAFTAEAGVELWKTDGTVAGTVLVSDINPGAASSSPKFSGNFSNISTPKVLFSATTDDAGRELYVTNATTAGTVFLGDLEPGTTGAFDLPENSTGDFRYIALSTLNQQTSNGQADVFNLFTTANGWEIWRTEGTAASTNLLEINPGVASSLVNTSGEFFFNYDIYFNNVTLRNVLIFGATNGSTGVELWRTNGTSTGTFILRDLVVGATSGLGDQKLEFTAVNNVSVFPLRTTPEGSELWVTNGNVAGTNLLKDIFIGANSGIDRSEVANEQFGAVGIPSLTGVSPSRIVFIATTAAEGNELWTTDGTTANTQLLADLEPGSETAFLGYKEFNALPTMEFYTTGRIVFPATISTVGTELFTTQGIPGDVQLLADVNPTGDAFSFLGDSEFVAFESSSNEELYLFAATNPTTGRELWRTNGTPAGTSFVKDIYPGAESGLGFGKNDLNDSHVYLLSEEGGIWFTGRDEQGAEPWFTDGTTGNTFQLKDINPGAPGSEPTYCIISGNDGTNPTGAFRQNGKFYLFASTEENGRELWVSEGSEPTTMLTGNIAPGASSAFTSQESSILYEAGEELVFSASDITLGFGDFEFPVNSEPWSILNGTPGPICEYEVSQTQLNISDSSQDFTITTQNGCEWSFTNLPNWIVPTETSGIGTATVTLTFADNTTGANRQGQFNVGGILVTVNQAPTEQPAKGDLYLFF